MTSCSFKKEENSSAQIKTRCSSVKQEQMILQLRAFVLFYLFLLFWDRVLLGSPGWPQACDPPDFPSVEITGMNHHYRPS
jgi:hypothetical protein